MLLHFLKDNADHLDETRFRSILVNLIGACYVDVIQRAHHLQKTAFVDFCSTSGNNSQKGSDYLQLYLLISFCGTFANFVDDGVD